MNFIKTGLLSTFQDTGRHKYRYMGVNPNGAMDKMALRLLNMLLQNSENEAAIEIHFPAPEIFFDHDTLIAIGGADFSPYLFHKNHSIQHINNWQCTWVKAGSTLKFSKRISGQRTYLAVKGGFKVSEWLGSKSTNTLLGFNDIKSGHYLAVSAQAEPDFYPYLGLSLRPLYTPTPVIRLIKGNEYFFLKDESKTALENQSFGISQQSNRMGFRLSGQALHLKEKTELISSAVDFGTIQLLPDGQLIILMADHQTTGGYPRIANVITVDLPLLAQCGPKDFICFKFITQAEAEELLIAQETELMKLKTSLTISRR
ncbi:biotin-dependent carboxyltransferase family protein [Emticicia sp. 17c]|uniref:5-oxoprolinase subunit C family protein n=1 Tax=Emticicia sp. 17c TaxID=3127704 RepID=UPI00301C781A